MHLNDLIAKLIKEVDRREPSEGGLILLTVESKAAKFVADAGTNATLFEPGNRDVLREARLQSVKDRAPWARFYIECHNPHVLYTSEADVALHVWRDGDNYLARCTKLRCVHAERPTEDFVLDWE